MIGTYNEGHLHEALKLRYSLDPNKTEVKVGEFVVDVVLDDRLVEIQTRGFTALKTKIPALLEEHSVTLVHPIPQKKTLVKLHADGHESRRLSPKRGSLYDVFNELVAIPQLLREPGFDIEVLMTHEEELRTYDARRGWRRRGWISKGRRLIDVIESHRFKSMSEFVNLVRPRLPTEFTSADLAAAMDRTRALGQKAAYCFRLSGEAEIVGKRGNTLVYRIA